VPPSAGPIINPNEMISMIIIENRYPIL